MNRWRNLECRETSGIDRQKTRGGVVGGNRLLGRPIIDLLIHFRGLFPRKFLAGKNLGCLFFWRRRLCKISAAAMTDGLLGSQADWIALWRSAMAAQDLTHREVDDRAGLGGVGTLEPGNKALVCDPCNTDKGSRTLASWLYRLVKAGDRRAALVAVILAADSAI
jgi:hypothetical protein